MSWQERFRKVADFADQKRSEERERVRLEEEHARKVKEERRDKIKALAPRIERVCKAFARGVKGKMKLTKRDENWSKENVSWRLEAKFGNMLVETCPPWYERLSDTHNPVQGIVLQYEDFLYMRQKVPMSSLHDLREALATEALSLHYVDFSKYFRAPRESGYYYKLSKPGTGFAPDKYQLVYFLSLKDFTEEVFAGVLEKVGYVRVRLQDNFDYKKQCLR